MNRREEWIDLAKGFAIVLVVLGHILRGFSSAGMYNEHEWIFDYIDFTIYSFHMPLFFVLSGYLYAKSKSITNVGEYKSLALKKLISLGIPYIIFSFAQGLVNALLSRYTNNPMQIAELLLIPVKPFGQFWYIYVLLFIFLIVALMDMLLKNNRAVLAILFIIYIVQAFADIPVFAVNKFMENALYFYLGKILFVHFRNQIRNIYILTGGSLLYIVLNYVTYRFAGNEFIKGPGSVVLAVSGIILSIMIVNLLINNIKALKKFFGTLGTYSFHIYLLHIVFASGIRVVLKKMLGIDSLSIHMSLGLVFGLLVPVLAGYFAGKIPAMDFFFNPSAYIFKSRVKEKPHNRIQAVSNTR